MAGLFIASLCFTACQKEQATVENTNQIPDNQIMALEPTDFWQGNPHKTFVVGLLQLANNNSFKTVLNDKIAEQFDGDDNVLLKDLLAACANNSINFSNAIKQGVLNYNNNLPAIEHPYTQYIASSDDNTIIGWINNGLSFGGQTYFLHVYIPFFDKVELESNPTIVFGLNETETTLGYKRNANNTISALVVDEEYAENNLVWVVAINETVNSNGVIERPAQPDEDAAHPSQQASHRVNDRTVDVQSIYITDRKENFLRGKAEVSVAIVKIKPNCVFGQNISARSMIKVKESELGSWRGNGIGQLASHPSFNSQNTPFSDGDRMFLVMYEYDAGPSSSFSSSICTATTFRQTVDTRNGIYGVIDLLDATTLNIPNSSGAANQIWTRTWGNGTAPSDSRIRLQYRIY